MRKIFVVIGSFFVLVILIFLMRDLVSPRQIQTTVETPTTTTVQETTQTVLNQTYGVQQTAISVTSNGRQLVGELYQPITNELVPVAIYAHELGMTQEAGRPYAKYLAEHGIATVIFDFSGGSPDSRSEGDTATMTITSEEQDLEAVMTAVRLYEGIDASQLHLIGASQGGLVAALTAAANPTEVKSLTLLYPAFLIPEVVRQLGEALGGRQQVTSLFGAYPIGQAYVNDVWNMDVYNTIGNYHGPVLIVHGQQDPLVDISYSTRAQEVYDDATLKIIPDAGHSFLDNSFGTVSQMIGDFIANNRR